MKAIMKGLAPLSLVMLFLIAIPLMFISGFALIVHGLVDPILLGIARLAIRIRRFKCEQ